MPPDAVWNAEEGVQCMYCKGRMEPGAVPFTVDRKGYHIHWEAVPAWVCRQCGEAYFEPPEVKGIQKALSAFDREASRVTVSCPPGRGLGLDR
jgi:YgiT-type zinc finger domain-containing protein